MIWRFYDFLIFSSNCGSPAEHAAENLFPFSNSRQSRLKRSEGCLRFFCTKFRANRKTGRGFPPHVPQGTPAFLKIIFQLHRNPTVLIGLASVWMYCMSCSTVTVTCNVLYIKINLNLPGRKEKFTFIFYFYFKTWM